MLDSRYNNMGFGGASFTKEARWDADLQWYELKPNTWNQIRLYGPVYIVAQNWFKTLKDKSFSLFSLAWDPFERSFNKQDQDPIFQFFGDIFNHPEKKVKDIAPRKQAYAQAFIRPTPGLAQGGEFKPVRLPSSVVSQIAKVAMLNYMTDQTGAPIFEDGQPKVADPTDADYGVDLMIYYDPNKQGAEKYSVQLGTKSPLTVQERACSAHFIDWHAKIKLPTVNEVKEALNRNGYMAFATSAGSQGGFGSQADIGAGHVAMPQMPSMGSVPQAPVMPAPAPGPMAPQMPAAPQVPQQAPAMPQAPAVPQMPQAPQMPMAPQAPQMPQAPAMPQAPQIPGKI
jgi:hypothetical protein